MAAATAATLTSSFTSFSKDLSSCKSISASRPSMAVSRTAPKVVCSAEKESVAAQAGKVATALALAAVIGTSIPDAAFADVAGLTPCKESKAFAKREKQEVNKLKKRLKLYEADSAPALALQATIEKTQKRFNYYGEQGLLCGTDGLPHLIVSGDQAHLGEFVFPGVVFLYIAGWIGWVGRAYLIETKKGKKPTQKEIIIDVPLATSILSKGFTWPLAAISEYRNGKLIVSDANVTVSPR